MSTHHTDTTNCTHPRRIGGGMCADCFKPGGDIEVEAKLAAHQARIDAMTPAEAAEAEARAVRQLGNNQLGPFPWRSDRAR